MKLHIIFEEFMGSNLYYESWSFGICSWQVAPINLLEETRNSVRVQWIYNTSLCIYGKGRRGVWSGELHRGGEGCQLASRNGGKDVCLIGEQNMHLVDAPKGVKPIRCGWVYKVKYITYGSINRYKEWLVAKGYVQQHDIDYDETFAPVAEMITVRVLLVVTTAKGWHLHKMYVKNMFLQGELEEQIYMVQPPRF